MPQVQAAMCVQSSVWPGAACRATAGQRTDGCVRVEKQSDGAGWELTGAGGQSGASVEAEPAHPEHGGADDGERDGVRPRLRVPGGVARVEARARAQHDGDNQRGDAGGGVDDDAAGEVDGAAAADAGGVFLGRFVQHGAVAECRKPAAAPDPVACARSAAASAAGNQKLRAARYLQTG